MFVKELFQYEDDIFHPGAWMIQDSLGTQIRETCLSIYIFYPAFQMTKFSDWLNEKWIQPENYKKQIGFGVIVFSPW